MTEQRCYICYESEGAQQLISPCNCNSYVHSLCVEKFELINNSVTVGRCRVCNTPYTFIKYGTMQQIYRKLLFTNNNKIYALIALLNLLFISIFTSFCKNVLNTQFVTTMYSLIFGMFCGGIIGINYITIKNQIISNIIFATLEREYRYLRYNIPEMILFISTIVFPVYYAISFSTLSHITCALLFNYFITSSFTLWILLMSKITVKRYNCVINYPKYGHRPVRDQGVALDPRND